MKLPYSAGYMLRYRIHLTLNLCQICSMLKITNIVVSIAVYVERNLTGDKSERNLNHFYSRIVSLSRSRRRFIFSFEIIR